MAHADDLRQEHAEVFRPSMEITTNPVELEYLLDLSLRVMKDKPLYSFVNQAFKTKSQSTAPLLSQTKIIFILSQLKDNWKDVEQYLGDNPNSTPPPRVVRRPRPHFEKALDEAMFNSILQRVLSDSELVKKLNSNISISQPLLIRDEKLDYTFTEEKFTSNHPRYEDPDDENSRVIPADDQRKLMVDLVNSMSKGDRLFFNFYDFDMVELADSLIAAKDRGVEIIGGIDKGVFTEKAAAREVVQKMIDAGVFIELVDSVGLNHQKLIAGIKKRGKSFAMFGSGNATQSCNGPEGDLKAVPQELRPDYSKPNPNHITLVDGKYAAVIVASEIKKNVIYKLRGQAGFPIGGAYMLNGKPQAKIRDNEKVLLVFSPNGGLGDINRDIYSLFFKVAKGPLAGAVFSMSSYELGLDAKDAVVREIKRRRLAGKSLKGLFPIIGDAQFAMRGFSVPLRLSGYRLVEFDPNDPFHIPGDEKLSDPEKFEPTDPSDKKVKLFVEDLQDPIVKEIRDLMTDQEWAQWRSEIRISPDWFKPQAFKWDGKSIENQVKLHYKGMAIPEMGISNAGSSINFSNAGESNQEQIIISMSRKVTKAFRGAMKYLWDTWSGPEKAIHIEVLKRNKFVSARDRAMAMEVLKFRQKIQTKISCQKFYGAKAN
tara:strand:- start:18455 stop:20416 length:1962 start_codon:yes stop_codon:yes gene_type:complete